MVCPLPGIPIVIGWRMLFHKNQYTMKKLVIITHPNIEISRVNKAWLSAIKDYGDQFMTHFLYAAYPDLRIDIQKEQELLLAHDEIIFQFPVHWFSVPFLLKKWIDEVLAFGWAFGPGGDKIKGKKIRFAISAGAHRDSYTTFESMEKLFKPFYVTFQYCGCEVLPMHSFYGAAASPQQEEIEANAREYVQMILKEA